MSDSILFSDLHAPETPAAVTTDLYKKDGIYVGEAIIKAKLANGKYKVTLNDNRIISCRAVFNLGENVFPPGIAVQVIVYNADGFIIGRVRPTEDNETDDGEVDTERSPAVGTEGDATLKSHSTDDSNNRAEVTVTRGGVVKLVSTGATSIIMHPHGERLIQKCQTLVAFSDAYRIESGRSSSTGGVSLNALTEETYKEKVGPVRTEVRIKNGHVDTSVVHQFSVDTLTTGGGVTSGVGNFKWTIDNTGVWSILNTLGV
ncbi:MAG: hypothetical protein ACYTBJ_20240, partial [Planctomycetota bacterium]